MKVNISTIDGMKGVEVNEYINIGKRKCFVHKEEWDDPSGFTWKVSEYTSGMFFGIGSTKKRAIGEARFIIKLYGVEAFNKKIEDAIKKYGVANT